MLASYATQQYQQMQVQTSPGKLVIMLYDGAVRFLHLGLEALNRGDLVAQSENIGRAVEIVSHLRSTLDMGAEPIAQQLESIYRYSLTTLFKANMENRGDLVQEVIELLLPLREAWVNAECSIRAEEAAAMESQLVGAGR